MENKERIESKELKEYLIGFAISKLEDCDLFTKTFGKGFAKKRLDINLDKVYIGKQEKFCSGYYNTGDLSITLNSILKEELELTKEDIENDQIIQGHALHELIHVIFAKTKLECKRSGLKDGTGLFEKYGEGRELGRGLNEGLTNWICEKVNLKTYSYRKLTRFIDLLELAIGEERVIKLAKGSIRKNATKQLGMTEKEVTRILAVTDDVYRAERKISRLENILQVLNEYSKRDSLDEKERDAVEKEYEKVTKDPVYISLLDSEEWKLAIKEGAFIGTLEEQRTFLKGKLEDEKELLGQDLNSFQEIVFSKYFEKWVEETSQLSEIPFGRMQTLDELNYLIRVYEQAGSEKLKISRFKEMYEQLAQKYELGIMKETVEAFENGTLTASRLKELEELNNRGRWQVDKRFIAKVSELINPEDSLAVYNLLYNLGMRGELDEANKYTLLTLNLGDIQTNAYAKDGKLVGTAQNLIAPENELTYEKNRDALLLDFTLDEDEYEQEIIKEFLKLKQKVEEQDKNAIIKVASRLISVESEERIRYYMINSGKIVPAEIDTTKPRRLNLAPEKNMYPTVAKESFLSRTWLALKRKLFGAKSNEIIYSTGEETSQEESFRNRISDMSNYDTSTPNTINSNGIEQATEREEDELEQ